MPWTNDKLKREQFGHNLSRVIKNQSFFRRVSEESLVIALDSKYGTGKTTFLDMWSKQLKADGNVLASMNNSIDKRDTIVIKLNAWENDDYDNALIPFIYAIQEKIENSDIKHIISKIELNKINAFQKSSLNSIFRLGKTIFNHSLNEKYGIDFENVMREFKEAKDDYSDELKSSYHILLDDYKQSIESKTSFKKSLKGITEKVDIVILIDELDRCRPSYAIETLETIKHYFDVPNITYILAIDLEQLAHAISTIYGYKMDSTGYLRKFFDVVLTFNKPSVRDYITYKLEMIEVKQRNSKMIYLITPEVTQFFIDYNLSLRDIDIILPSLCLFLLKLRDDLDNYRESDLNSTQEIYSAIAYLLFMRHKNPKEYRTIIDGNFKFMVRTQYNGDEIDDLTKSNVKGVNSLKKFLSNGQNQNRELLVYGKNDGTTNFEKELINFSLRYCEHYSPRPRSIGDFLRAYIEESFTLLQ